MDFHPFLTRFLPGSINGERQHITRKNTRRSTRCISRLFTAPNFKHLPVLSNSPVSGPGQHR
jgi:hypothetical protein